MFDYPKLAREFMKKDWQKELNQKKGIKIEIAEKYHRKFAEFESPTIDLNPHNMTELINKHPDLFEKVGVEKCDLPVFQKAYYVNKEERNTSTASDSNDEEQDTREVAEVPGQPVEGQGNNGPPTPRRIKFSFTDHNLSSWFYVPEQVRSEYNAYNNELEVSWRTLSQCVCQFRLYLVISKNDKPVLYEGRNLRFNVPGHQLNFSKANTFELVSFHGNEESMPVTFQWNEEPL